MNALYSVRLYSHRRNIRATVLVDVRRSSPERERNEAKASAINYLEDRADDWACTGLSFVCETPNSVLMEA